MIVLPVPSHAISISRCGAACPSSECCPISVSVLPFIPTPMRQDSGSTSCVISEMVRSVSCMAECSARDLSSIILELECVHFLQHFEGNHSMQHHRASHNVVCAVCCVCDVCCVLCSVCAVCCMCCAVCCLCIIARDP